MSNSSIRYINLISVFVVLLWLTPADLFSQEASVRTEKIKFGTYSFSDPDPVPNIGYIYPYNRFDGYSDRKTDKDWLMVILENDFIKVFITPEIGGKIWGAIEKSTGREFIYYNHVVKFRDVAMRGAWTSGGIETNFGVIGHAPTVSTPVDYVTRKNEDGSVSCIIRATDLASGTVWRLEVNLPADKAWFSTRAIWYNPTNFNQSYYHWMNAAVKTEGNLEYTYPGSNFIGHDGTVSDWPITKSNRDISWYANNNFGRYKSYHVLGELTNFYGGYYHDDNFGFGHYSDFDEKPGKKLWIWGLSNQGMIWEKLLTDSDGQYTEVQSGRLFNQEASSSIYTPFKHKGFVQGSMDTWEELWFPIKETKGAMQAIPQGVINLESDNGSLVVYFNANEYIDSELILMAESKELLRRQVKLSPTEVISFAISFSGNVNAISARLGDRYIIPPGGMEKQKMSRPLYPAAFDWETAYGQYVMGTQKEDERNFSESESSYKNSLAIEPGFMPALSRLAALKLKRMDFDSALYFSKTVLALDTYSPEANFVYAATNEEQGNLTDALDGYAIASQSPEFRSASYQGMIRIFLIRNEYSRALEYCKKSIEFSQQYIPVRELQIFAFRKAQEKTEAVNAIGELLKIDPLNHFAYFEKYLITRDEKDLVALENIIQSEFPAEVYLEQAVKYYSIKALSESLGVLNLSPLTPMVMYWKAFLGSFSDATMNALTIVDANKLSPEFNFPYRRESKKVLEWVVKVNPNWKPKYYLGLIEWNLGNVQVAKDIFLELGDEPDFYPLYLAKAELFSAEASIARNSLLRAVELGKDEWRSGYALSKYFLNKNDLKAAREISTDFFQRFPKNYYLGLQQAKILLRLGENAACLDLLQNLKVLPNEGATEGRSLYRQANHNLAKEALLKKEFDIARRYIDNSRLWPENLGVGRPYQVDERIEDYLLGRTYQLSGDKKQSLEYFSKIVISEVESSVATKIVVIAAYKQMGDLKEADNYLKGWQAEKDTLVIEWCQSWLNGEKRLNTKSNDESIQWVMDLLIKDK